MAQTFTRHISRRGFLKTAGATALAAGAGPAFIIPGRAQPKTLKILHWRHFVAGYDRWFNGSYVKEWGENNGTNVVVESIGLGDLSSRATGKDRSFGSV